MCGRIPKKAATEIHFLIVIIIDMKNPLFIEECVYGKTFVPLKHPEKMHALHIGVRVT